MKKLRAGLAGYGFIMENGHAHAYRTRRDVEIVAIADIAPERRAIAARQWPAARIYADAETMFAGESENLDFADIATPPSEHAAVARAAFARGLHVLCEKPLATTTEDARDLLSQAVRVRRVLYPCHNYKHAPVIKAVREILGSGRIGKVHLVTLQTFRATHAKGVAGWRSDWRREHRHSGGGIAMDHGSHTFYLAFEWLGAYPIAISARMSTTPPFDTEDDISCTMRFPTGVASAHLSWNAGVRKVLYTIHGSRGAVRVEDDAIEVALQRVSPAGELGWTFERQLIPSEWMDSSHATWFDSLFTDFRGAISRGEYVGRDAKEAFLCVQLITSSYESSREGSRELPLPALSGVETAATGVET